MPALTTKYPLGVQRLHSDAPIEDIFYLLKRDGGVVIEKFLDVETVNRANREILPHLEKDKKWEGSFFPGETRRATALNEICPTFTNNMLTDSRYQAVVRHFLTTKNTFWWGKEQKTSVSLPQVSADTAIQIGPGAGDQEIHRVRIQLLFKLKDSTC